MGSWGIWQRCWYGWDGGSCVRASIPSCRGEMRVAEGEPRAGDASGYGQPIESCSLPRHGHRDDESLSMLRGLVGHCLPGIVAGPAIAGLEAKHPGFARPGQLERARNCGFPRQCGRGREVEQDVVDFEGLDRVDAKGGGHAAVVDRKCVEPGVFGACPCGRRPGTHGSGGHRKPGEIVYGIPPDVRWRSTNRSWVH
jgi:hypothetical protein